MRAVSVHAGSRGSLARAGEEREEEGAELRVPPEACRGPILLLIYICLNGFSPALTVWTSPLLSTSVTALMTPVLSNDVS